MKVTQEACRQAADKKAERWTVANWKKVRTRPTIRHWPKVIEWLGCDPSPEPKTLGERLRRKRWGRGLSIRGEA